MGGVADSGEAYISSRQHFPDMNSSSVHSASADMIRDNLPLVTFGMFAERFCQPMGDVPVCTVCLSSFEEEDEVRELRNCHHIFHRNCLDKWVDHSQTTCPVCRSSLMPKAIPVTELNNSWVLDWIIYIFAEDLSISS